MKRLVALFLLLPFIAWAGEPIAVPPQATVTISCTSSSAATALPTVGAGQLRQVEISNAGTVAAFVEFGASTVTSAVASGYPYLANQTKVQTIKPDTTHVACITGGTTVTIYATVGIGQ